MHALLLALVMLADLNAPANLAGKVISADSAPVPNATVLIYSGAPRKGPPKQAATEIPDTAKSVTTDSQGAFTLRGVDASMTFELLVIAEGYRPIMLKKVDPARGEIQAKLSKIPADAPADQIVRGRVTDPDGKPILGAHVLVRSERFGNDRIFGPSPNAEQQAFSDAKGEFALVCTKPGLSLDLMIEAKNLAPQIATSVPEGEQATEIVLTAGARVAGRLVQDGKPVATLPLKLLPAGDSFNSPAVEATTVSGSDGKFVFPHVHPDSTYNLIAPMKTAITVGALSPRPSTVTGDGTDVNLGDISVEEGFKLAGQIVMADEKAKLPSSGRLELYHSETSDTVQIPIGADGKFELAHIPPGLYYLSLQAGGYRFTHENQSFYESMYLYGTIQDNITDLRLQVERGSREQNVSIIGNTINRLQSTPITGLPAQ